MTLAGVLLLLLLRLLFLVQRVNLVVLLTEADQSLADLLGWALRLMIIELSLQNGRAVPLTLRAGLGCLTHERQLAEYIALQQALLKVLHEGTHLMAEVG